MIRYGRLGVGVALLAGVVLAVALVASAGANHSLQVHISTGSSGGNGNFDAFFAGTSAAGTPAFFETDEKLVAADTDGQYDIYQRSGTATTIVSTGTTGGNGAFDAVYHATSSDGARVFFDTEEKLAAADTDNQFDVYQRSGGTTTLVSTGPSGGNGPNDTVFRGISDDGSRVFFETDESLVAGDTDTVTDVYERSGGSTTHVSTGPSGGNGSFFADFAAASADGSVVIFITDESLVAADTDAEVDLYQRSGGATTLVSTGSAGGNGAFAASFSGISASGSRVFFTSAEQLEPGDTDSSSDIYQRSSGATTRISTGPAGGNGAFVPLFSGSSADGSRVFFETREVLTADDTDASRDVYERAGATTTRLSTGLTGGNGAVSAFFEAASETGNQVFFTTAESLLASDTDAVTDVYERSGTTTTHVSTSTTGSNGAFPVAYVGSSKDGARVFLETDESLSTGDTDAVTDVYERFAGATTRISTGPTGGNGAFPAFYWTNSADGRRAYFDTLEPLATSDTDTAIDVYVAIADQLFPRPGGATPLRVSMAPAYQQCTSPNSTHIAPLDEPSCTPAVQESALLTTSSIGRGLAAATLSALPGNTGTMADEADFSITASATDVLNKVGGTDYTGKVILTTRMRVTDQSSGYSGEEGGTVQDAQFSVPFDCVATPSDPAGSSCTVTTTADTLLPNFIKETKRTIISTFTVNLLDAGADGSITPPSGACPLSCGSGDEKVFMTQGVLAP